MAPLSLLTIFIGGGGGLTFPAPLVPPPKLVRSSKQTLFLPSVPGSLQTNSAKHLSVPSGQTIGSAYQSSTGCVGGHCVGLPASGRKDGGGTMSVTQASIARKKTHAGLGEWSKLLQIHDKKLSYNISCENSLQTVAERKTSEKVFL